MDTDTLHLDTLAWLQTGIVVHAASTEVVYCNARACELLGLSEDQMLGKTTMDPIWQFVHENGQPVAPEQYPVRQVLARGQPVKDVVLGIVAGAHTHTVWLLVSAFAQRDADGAVLRVVVDFHDITARVLAQRRVLEHEVFTTAVLNSLTEHIAVLDRQGRIVAVNLAWRQFAQDNGGPTALINPLGVNYLGECLSGQCTPGADEGSDSARGIAAVLRGERAEFKLEYPCHSPTRQRWFRMSVTPFGGAAGGAVVSHFDITAQRLSGLQAQRNMQLLMESIEAIDEAFVIFSPDEKLVYCNEKYRLIYPQIAHLIQPGIDFEQLIRLGAQAGVYKESTGRVEAWVQERLLAFRSGNQSRVQRMHDGRIVRAVERKMADGHTVGFRIDITDLVTATDAAQAAAASKGQFLATMSHEIRTPMNAILGMLQLLQHTPLNGQQLDYTAKAESAAKSLLGLINDVLDFSKVEAGKMVLDVHPTRLDRLLRDLSVILGAGVASKPIDVLFDIDPHLPEVVQADALRLRQVLINLGNNAVKFTEHGQVLVTLRATPLPHDPAGIEFCVQDSGIGIAPEHQARIFEGFSQAEASTTRKFGGTGLGLAISQRLVQLMGGELALVSMPGQGTTFSFTLSLAPVTDVPAELREPAPADSQPRRALVVDDNELAARLTQQMVRAWGWSCQCCGDAAQALAWLGDCQPGGPMAFDVIYLDAQLAGLDGWETARAIRQRCAASGAAQPIVVLISRQGRETALLARSAREQELVNGFLVRPVTASMLYDAAVDPAFSRAQSAHTEMRRGKGPRLSGVRLLVVEDNLINQQVAEELLAAEGALVALAANGLLGVQAVAAAQPPFDAVLMDIQMPVMDGFAATRAIRQELGLSTLPIIAMTANALQSDRLDCLAGGMDEHVGKPFDITALVDVITRLVRGSDKARR